MPPMSTQNAKAPKMGKAFRRIRAAMVGDLYQGNLFAQWVRRNGGEFHDKVSNKVTHLIASEQAYEENVEEVQAAKALGKIKIVSRDWLTASLHANPIRPVSERPFLLENLVKPAKNASEGRNGTDGTDSGPKSRIRLKDPFIEKKSPKGSKSAKSIILPKKVISREPQTGAAWDAVLVRDGKTPRLRERFRLAIFETTSDPATYSTWAKYSRVGTSRVEELTPAKSDMALAIQMFKGFFKVKTGKDWEDRDDCKLPTPKADEQGNILPIHEGWYIYKSQDNIFTSFLMQAGRSGGSPTGAITVEQGDTTGGPESEFTRIEGTAPSNVSPQSEGDICKHDDVTSDSINVDVGKTAKSEPAVDADIKAAPVSRARIEKT